MQEQLVGSLGARRGSAGAVLVDLSCGLCHSCCAGAPLWCQSPGAEGRDLSPAITSGRVDDVAAALMLASAVTRTPVGATVLVLADEREPVALVLAELATGRVVVAPDVQSARSQLASEPTGRAAVVASADEIRAAVRAVRRGGHVCTAGPAASRPSVTELVQREVTLVGPNDVAGVAGRIPTVLWDVLATA